MNLATTTALTAVEKKIPNDSTLVKKTKTQKLVKLRRKLLIMIMISILVIQNLMS